MVVRTIGNYLGAVLVPGSEPQLTSPAPRVIVVSGGTDGMGRSLALARAQRGDRVLVLGSNPEKGRRVVAESEALAAGEPIDFIQADLSSVSDTRRAIADIEAQYPVVDALGLFANRQATQRRTTAEGLEHTFALYYLSRYLLSHELAPLLRRSRTPVIINVAGVGTSKGKIHWDDLQLERGYSAITAQLQAGRANDLLGVAYAARTDSPARYVLYHPGFTKSGDLSPLPAAARVFIRAAAAVAARPVARAIAPVHEFIDSPPAAALTANDRGTQLPLTLTTLDPASAARLAKVTRSLVELPCSAEH
nr:SDR family NAD(P)-dependent oxidoreductase [Ruania zhangjianzhongii]